MGTVSFNATLFGSPHAVRRLQGSKSASDGRRQRSARRRRKTRNPFVRTAAAQVRLRRLQGRESLKKLTNRKGKIISRRKRVARPSAQHAVTRATKRGRFMALLPYTGQVDRRSSRSGFPANNSSSRSQVRSIHPAIPPVGPTTRGNVTAPFGRREGGGRATGPWHSPQNFPREARQCGARSEGHARRGPGWLNDMGTSTCGMPAAMAITTSCLLRRAKRTAADRRKQVVKRHIVETSHRVGQITGALGFDTW